MKVPRRIRNTLTVSECRMGNFIGIYLTTRRTFDDSLKEIGQVIEKFSSALFTIDRVRTTKDMKSHSTSLLQ